MARRRAARGPAGGGAGIQAQRRPFARLTTAALALALAAGVAVWVGLGARPPEAAAAIGAPAVLVLAAALVAGWPALVPPALALVGAEYAFALRGHHGVDGRAPLVATALLLAAELAYWSLERRLRAQEERLSYLRRAIALAGLTLAALLVTAVLTGVTRRTFGSGVALEAAGVAAAAAALAIVAALARTREREVDLDDLG